MYLSPLLLVGLLMAISALMSLAFKGGYNTGWQDGRERGVQEGKDEAISEFID